MPRITRPDMSAYGVPEDLEGTLPWSWAEERLARSRNFWLVTVSDTGRPHAMPVWGVWMPDRERFGFSCAPSARKVRNLAADNRVVVTNDDAGEVVSVEGRAEEITGAALLAMSVRYADKYKDEPMIGEPEGMVAFLQENAAYEVSPDRAFGIIETAEEFGTCATKWVWD